MPEVSGLRVTRRMWAGMTCGAEGDVVGAVVPLVVDAGEQVFDVEGLVVADAELLEVEVDPAGLLVVGIEVDDGEDDVGGTVVGGGRDLGVGDDLRVVDVVEVEREVALQRGVGAADLVEAGDERRDGLRGASGPSGGSGTSRC